ncbi:zinc finger MYM-type protein 1-like protein [Tanacetum coccineum]|uniref:Zinc finger MYM-type protein 1-like protein n=1 Tax=Tanacetum coccineum TaxID=301880 RepID=A0ABQ5J953_9ASTR
MEGNVGAILRESNFVPQKKLTVIEHLTTNQTIEDHLKMEMEMGYPVQSHKGVKASANSDIIFFFTSAQDGNRLLDDERLSLADDLKKAHDHNQNKNHKFILEISSKTRSKYCRSGFNDKRRLKTSGFDAFLKIVNSFCEKHDFVVLKMDEIYVAKRNQVAGIKNRQYFEIDIFNTVLDMQIQEFGDRFGRISTDLCINMSALSLGDSFSMFDASELITLTTFYRDDFTDADRFSLSRELDLYYEIVIHDT